MSSGFFPDQTGCEFLFPNTRALHRFHGLPWRGGLQRLRWHTLLPCFDVQFCSSLEEQHYFIFKMWVWEALGANVLKPQQLSFPLWGLWDPIHMCARYNGTPPPTSEIGQTQKVYHFILRSRKPRHLAPSPSFNRRTSCADGPRTPPSLPLGSSRQNSRFRAPAQVVLFIPTSPAPSTAPSKEI